MSMKVLTITCLPIKDKMKKTLITLVLTFNFFVVFSQPVVRGSFMTPGLLKEKLREDYYFRDTFINNNGKIFIYTDNVRYPYIINNYLSDTVGRFSIKEIMVGGDNGVMLLKRQYTNGKDTLLELMKHQFYIKDNGDAFYTDSILFTFNKTKFYDTKLYFLGYSELFGDSSYLFAVRNFKKRNGKLRKAISPEDEMELNKLQIDPYKW